MLELFKSKKETAQQKILIVDDETDIVSTVQYRLKSCDYDVIVDNNGQEGLEKAMQEKPDIILLDINMPVMNGLEMLERLRNYPELKNTPVIMVTAYSDSDDINKAADFGISNYVTKPFNFAELTEEISKALQGNTD